MRNEEIKNKPQTTQGKNDKKTKQEISAAYYAQQQPSAQQNQRLYPQVNRYIRSWVEGSPDQQK